MSKLCLASQSLVFLLGLLGLPSEILGQEHRFLVPVLEPNTVLHLANESTEAAPVAMTLYSAGGEAIIFEHPIARVAYGSPSAVHLGNYLLLHSKARGGWAELVTPSEALSGSYSSSEMKTPHAEPLSRPSASAVALVPSLGLLWAEAARVVLINTTQRAAQVRLQGIAEDGRVLWAAAESVAPFARTTAEIPLASIRSGDRSAAIASVLAHSTEPIWMSGILYDDQEYAPLPAVPAIPAAFLQGSVSSRAAWAAVRVRVFNFSEEPQELSLVVRPKNSRASQAFPTREILLVPPRSLIDRVVSPEATGVHGIWIELTSSDPAAATLVAGVADTMSNEGLVLQSVGLRRLGEIDLSVVPDSTVSAKADPKRAAQVLDRLFAPPVLNPPVPKVDLSTCKVSFSATFTNPLTPKPPISTRGSLADVFLKKVRSVNAKGHQFNPAIVDLVLPGEKFTFGVVIEGTKNAAGNCNTPIQFWVSVMGDPL